MKMIIVDDERASREGMVQFIDWHADYGIDIAGTAANGQEGLQLYRSVRPDLVLTDIKMPIMSGIEMAEKIRSQDSTVKIILLSAYSEFSYAQQAVKTGVDDYLLKPIEEHELRVMLGRIAAERMAQHHRDDSKNYFLDVLQGRKASCLHLQDCIFQAIILDKEPKLKTGQDQGLWLMEFHEGANVGIAKYESEEDAYETSRRTASLFAYRFAGSCVNSPDEIKRSYSEAVLAQYVGSFWELRELSFSHIIKLRTEWSRQESEINRELHKLADDMKNAALVLNRSRIEAAAHRTIQYLSRKSGIDPGYIEDFLFRLVTFVADEFSTFNGMRDSVWEFKMSLQRHNRFRGIKEILISWLMDLLARIHEREELSETTIIKRVIRIIEEEYAQEVGLRLIADRVYLSPNYLGSIFKEATGMYFNDYLTDYRMKKAAELLLSGSEKVTNIGGLVGIPNHSYFSSLFKKTYGVSPKEYRRNPFEIN